MLLLFYSLIKLKTKLYKISCFVMEMKKIYSSITILIIVFGIGIVVLLFPDSNNQAGGECGDDFDCFVRGSGSCVTSSVDYSVTLNVFGILQTTESKYELAENNRGDCVLSWVVEGVKTDFSDELIENLVSQGSSESEIEAQLEEANNQNEGLLVGKDGTCRGSASEISSLLGRWNEGTFDTSDFDGLNCRGSYFVNTNNGGNNEGNSQVGGTITFGDATEYECFLFDDCDEGFFCNDQECVPNAIAEALSSCSSNGACSETCTNCEEGTFKCLYSTKDILALKCVECSKDSNCNEGYVCNSHYECVSE